MKQAAPITVPIYFECARCGFLHPEGWTGSCDALDGRFDPDELDDMFGPEGWVELDPAEIPGIPQSVPETPPEPTGRRSYDRMMALTPYTDIDGNVIEVGAIVRCFLGSYYVIDNDRLCGIDTMGRHSYVEGKILSIGEFTPSYGSTEIYYLIEVQREAGLRIERRGINYVVGDMEIRIAGGRENHIANGAETPSVRVRNGVYEKDGTMPCKTFGVVRVG